MKNPDLFSSIGAGAQDVLLDASGQLRVPLAARCRPRTIDDFIGQLKLLGPDSPIRRWLKVGQIPSLIVWGPPGSGKTSFARLLGESLPYHFEEMSGPSMGVADLKKMFSGLRDRRDLARTILFVDEIHRLTKVQQDALLLGVEEGIVTLIGVTTENPQYSISRALQSRCQILPFEPHNLDSMRNILKRALARNPKLSFKQDQEIILNENLKHIAHVCAGDARRALNLLELLLLDDPMSLLNADTLCLRLNELSASKAYLGMDEDVHYRFTSDFIKAMRRGDERIALDRLARLLAHGEDPLFLARRLIIFAAEDVGLASPHLMTYVNAVFDSVAKVGMPESRIALSAATLAACRAKKSREAYDAIAAAEAKIETDGGIIPT